MTAPCPPPEQLLRSALADANAPRDGRVMRHLRECEACRETVRQLRETADALRHAAPHTDAVTPECLDDEWIAAFAEGSAEPAESQAQLEHLLTCARCSQQVASVARLLGDASVATEIERLTPGAPAVRTRRLRAIGAVAGVAAAAAVVFAIARTDSAHRAGVPTYREQSVTGAVPPVALAPKGPATTADSFRWTSVPRADRYRITVFDRDGGVQWEVQTRDTALAIPPQLAQSSGATYLWRVEARVGWEERWVASELTEFTVRAPPPR